MKWGLNTLRELKHDFHHIWPIPICYGIGLVLGLVAFSVRKIYRCSKPKSRLRHSELWIDMSSMQRYQRLLRLARRADLPCIEKTIGRSRMVSALHLAWDILAIAAHEKPVLRIFCRSGDQVYWLIGLTRFMCFIVLDIYDTRPAYHNAFRKTFENWSIGAADWLSCRDLRLSGGLERRAMTSRKRTLVLDPPYFSQSERPQRELLLKDARVINAGWVGPVDTHFPMVETYKLLLALGLKLTILPSPTQTWAQPSLQAYKDLADEYSNLKLLEPVCSDELRVMLLANDFGLLASDWEWHKMAPYWAYSDDSPQRDKGIRVTDYVAAGLGVITCRRKWFARRFAMRYAASVVDLDDIKAGRLVGDSVVRVGGSRCRGSELEQVIMEALRKSRGSTS